MKSARLNVLLGCVFYIVALSANALPTKCLQLPERLNACPHLIYKKAAMSVVLLDVVKDEVICICLSDVNVLNNQTPSALEQIDQQVTLDRLTRYYQLTEQDILTLIKQ